MPYFQKSPLCAWGTVLCESFSFFGYRLTFNDSFWAPATREVALQSLTRLAGMRMACMDLLGDLGWFARPEVH